MALFAGGKKVEALEAEVASLRQWVDRLNCMDAVQLERLVVQTRAELGVAQGELSHVRGEVARAQGELAQARQGIVEAHEEAILQEVGIYAYRHPLDSALAYRQRQVYGLYEGRAVLTSGGIPVLVEGPLDAIAVSVGLDRRGAGLATCGTALTAAQLNRIDAATDPTNNPIVVRLDRNPRRGMGTEHAGQDHDCEMLHSALGRGLSEEHAWREGMMSGTSPRGSPAVIKQSRLVNPGLDDPLHDPLDMFLKGPQHTVNVP